MKRLLAGSTLFCAIFSATAFGESWTGTLVDVMCKGKDLAGHTRECALTCAKSGFGVVTADGKFIKFDESGNARAMAALKSATKEKDLKVKVNGSMDGETLQVESLSIQ